MVYSFYSSMQLYKITVSHRDGMFLDVMQILTFVILNYFFLWLISYIANYFKLCIFYG